MDKHIEIWTDGTNGGFNIAVNGHATELGELVREGFLDAVFVQQGAALAGPPPSTKGATVPPEVRRFLKSLATTLAKEWAR